MAVVSSRWLGGTPTVLFENFFLPANVHQILKFSLLEMPSRARGHSFGWENFKIWCTLAGRKKLSKSTVGVPPQHKEKFVWKCALFVNFKTCFPNFSRRVFQKVQTKNKLKNNKNQNNKKFFAHLVHLLAHQCTLVHFRVYSHKIAPNVRKSIVAYPWKGEFLII